MDKELVMELINSLVYVVLTVILPILTTFAIRVMKAQTSKIRYEAMEEMHMDWVIKAVDIVADIVKSVQQTYVDSLKQKGEFNAEAAKEAKDKAVTLAQQLIADEIKEVIGSVYTSFDAWLDVQIEKTVQEIK